MFSVVAVNKNWAIGNEGKLLYNIKNDMKHFKELTVGKAVIMGRKTLESLPKGKPLPNRVNYVLTQNKDYQVEGATVLHSLEEAIEVIKSYPSDGIACIGGSHIYELLLPYNDYIEATVIDDENAIADSFFPNLEKLGWKRESQEDFVEEYKYSFVKYVK